MVPIYCLVYFTVLKLVQGECPANPLEEVRDCTASILPELNTQALSEGPEAYRRRIQVLQDSCTYVAYLSKLLTGPSFLPVQVAHLSK